MSASLDILIEEMDGCLWTAALAQGRLEGLEVDPPQEEVRWGSIYLARVDSVDAALDAVYLNLDGDNIGILYNKDTREKDKSGNIIKGGSKAIGKSFKPGDMIVVQAKSAYLQREWERAENKITQMSMDVTISGRYLIYSPLMPQNRISQRIRKKSLRTQIQTMMENLEDIQGCIIRAAAANAQTDILRREGKILKAAWDEMQEFLTGNEPSLIMLGPDAVQRTLSDHADKTIDHIEVVTMDHLHHVEDWCSLFAPDLVPKIHPIELQNATEDLALYHERDIIGQIEDLLHDYALLPEGGNLIIQTTASMTVVDVNRGGDKGSNLSINIQAAKEIARQLRLRNIGGIVMVDFLKDENKSKKQLLTALDKATQQDPCTVQIHGLTKLGIMEITRKRRTPHLEERIGSYFQDSIF